jgi:hypothetical protein
MRLKTPPSLHGPALVAWGVLALILCAHWLLFAEYVRREVAWAYAPNYDQTAVLQLSYRTYEEIRQDGPWPALTHALRTLPPTGATLHLEAAALFALTRPSRLKALGVNWLHFALLQVAVFAAVRARAGGFRLPALALGLLWCLATPFFYAGGLDDFRFDFAGWCLYGTFLALVMRSGTFRQYGWCLAAGATATLCVLTRSLTSVYLGGVMTLWIAVVGWRSFRVREDAARADARRQLAGTLLATACLVLVALPSLAVRARSLWHYYVVGHVTGAESAVRKAESGLSGGLDNLAYYPASLLSDHAGPVFLWTAVVALVLLALFPRPRAERALAPPAFPRDSPWFVALSAAVPLTVLTADAAKSVIVGGVLAHPLLWAVVLAASGLARRARPQALLAVAIGVLAAGAGFQVVRLGGPSPTHLASDARKEVARLHDDVFRVSGERGWRQPHLLADRKRDYVPATFVAVYERHGVVLDIRHPMGEIVWEPTDREIGEALDRSHLVIVTMEPPPPHWTYPYDRTLAALRPWLLEQCGARMSLVGTYRVPEEVRLYARVGPAEKSGPLVSNGGAPARR